jgi:hypothetical protein
MRNVRRSTLLVPVLALAAGCSGSSGGSSFGSGGRSIAATVSSSMPTPVTSASTTSLATTAAVTSAPRIALTARGLSINGKVKPLLGGELQYFRIRDPQWDATRTQQLWEEALDQAQAAGVTLISTYVPWDFHEENQGTFDFTGPRDLDHFLESCWKRGLAVYLKPGPFINAEWPNGLGSFGGVPDWWKNAHPAALARQPNGQPFSFDLLGRATGYQPSFFAADFRQAATRWFTTLAPIVKKYVHDRPTIAMLQIDNETNFYFKSRFSVDYCADSQAQYQGWLATKYGTIGALNTLYGTAYASFADVVAPSSAPSQDSENLPSQDWFDAGKAGIAEYHAFLRSQWEALGIQEPDILFTTNDSPHAMPTMDIQLWDGPTKNKAGLSALDAYPKQFPWSFSKPLDYPFLTSFFTKRFLEANGDYSFAGQAPQKMKGAFAAEIEGGLFNLPLNFPLPIPDAATDHVLLEFFGHGGVVGSIYTFRGGLNHDGSTYFDMACVSPQGQIQPRYALASRFGNGLLGAHADAFMASSDVEAPVALVVGARFDSPANGVAGHPAWIQAREAPGVFGWLEDGGLSPAVIDGRRVKKGDLDRFKAVVYVDPDAADDDLATALDDYVQRGGSLVNLMHNGRHDGSWRAGGVAGGLLAGGLFSDGTLVSTYEETLGFLFSPNANLALPNGFTGHMGTSSFIDMYDVSGPVTVFAHDRTAPFGFDGHVTGWQTTRGLGQVIFFGTSPGASFRDSGYYDAAPSELATARSLATWIAAATGLTRTLEVDDATARAFARKIDPTAGGGALIFMASRLSQAGTSTLRLLDLPSLGLDPGTTYTLVDTLSGQSYGQATGATLNTTGLAVPLGAYGTAVIKIAP